MALTRTSRPLQRDTCVRKGRPLGVTAMREARQGAGGGLEKDSEG